MPFSILVSQARNLGSVLHSATLLTLHIQSIEENPTGSSFKVYTYSPNVFHHFYHWSPGSSHHPLLARLLPKHPNLSLFPPYTLLFSFHCSKSPRAIQFTKNKIPSLYYSLKSPPWPASPQQCSFSSSHLLNLLRLVSFHVFLKTPSKLLSQDLGSWESPTPSYSSDLVSVKLPCFFSYPK